MKKKKKHITSLRSHLFASSADTYIHTIPFKILTGSRRLLFPYASPDSADSAACGIDTCPDTDPA